MDHQRGRPLLDVHSVALGVLARGGSIEVYTSHWRNALLKDVDAVIVGVSRGTPRRSPGYRYRVLRSLAPNDTAWNAPDRESFEKAYGHQLDGLGVETILADLRRTGGGRPVVCLCWERLDEPGEWCHRRQLADYLEREAGISVRELAPGDLPQREDAPEPRLF